MTTDRPPREPTPRRRQETRFGMRARASIAFALMAALVSSGLALLAYELSRRYLLDQRVEGATRQAFLDARAVNEALQVPDADVAAVLAALAANPDSQAILFRGDEQFSSGVALDPESLPADLATVAGEGSAGYQRFRVGGESAVAVAVPLPAIQATYYEVFPLDELERTLSTLARILTGGAMATTAVGALLGRYASSRVVRPLREVWTAARRIARGDLRARLDERADRDLIPLVRAFNEMAGALEERVARDARFASDVSHELRTPLTALSASVEVLESRVGERARPALDVLRNQTRYFEQLVLDLLEISRYDVGAVELETVEVDPANFVESVLRASGHGAVPLVVTPGTPQRATLDRRRVERVLANLLENADQYAGGATRVELSGGANGILRLVVEDDGPGVPPEEAQRVFERFRRLNVRGRGGTGLGLALVDEHCRAHGGRAFVEAAVGGGARFVAEFQVG